MIKIKVKRAEEIMNNFNNKKIVILGDIMLDQYIIGKVSRISPEAPVPVLEIDSEKYFLGGAGNVALNLEALSADYLLVGVIGDDNSGKKILENIKDRRGIFVDKGRPTIVKTRIIAHHQHVVRVDREKRIPIPEEIEKKILNFIINEKFDGLIISDYNKGTITESLLKNLLKFTYKNKIPVFVDPKVEHFNFYSPITLITPNQSETERILNRSLKDEKEIERGGKEILSKIKTEYLIITRGERGMTVFVRDNKIVHIPTMAKEVYDVTGAGDTVIATASLCLISGADILESAILANYAAGVVVGKLGTATVSRKEILREIKKEL